MRKLELKGSANGKREDWNKVMKIECEKGKKFRMATRQTLETNVREVRAEVGGQEISRECQMTKMVSEE